MRSDERIFFACRFSNAIFADSGKTSPATISSDISRSTVRAVLPRFIRTVRDEESYGKNGQFDETESASASVWIRDAMAQSTLAPS